MARFIVKENSCHHRNAFYQEANFLDEIKLVYAEDLVLYNSSVYYVAICNGNIIGSVKITLWDQQTVLPIQKLFNIQCEELPFFINGQHIWHVGRFAISKNGNQQGTVLLRELLTLAIYSICGHPNSVMLAECDAKLLKILNLLGIKTKELAPSVEYLGSETFPVYATDEWLNVFLNKNDYIERIKMICSTDKFFRILKLKEQADLSANSL